MLDQLSAADDVEQLKAAADAEHREVALECVPRGHDLELVTLWIDTFARRHRERRIGRPQCRRRLKAAARRCRAGTASVG